MGKTIGGKISVELKILFVCLGRIHRALAPFFCFFFCFFARIATGACSFRVGCFTFPRLFSPGGGKGGGGVGFSSERREEEENDLYSPFFSFFLFRDTLARYFAIFFFYFMLILEMKFSIAINSELNKIMKFP